MHFYYYKIWYCRYFTHHNCKVQGSAAARGLRTLDLPDYGLSFFVIQIMQAQSFLQILCKQG